MAQGNKLKTKAKLPGNVKQKQKNQGQAFNRRKNAPIKQKKQKFQEAQKLKQIVSKAVNQNIEDEMRRRATDGQNLSKIQEAVAKHHQNQSSGNDASTSSVTS